MSQDALEFDVIIVGAGPSGLSAAIRLLQLKPDVSVCVFEKGAEVGAHILSGAVLEPRALDELLPDWKQKNAPVTVQATEDHFLWLTEKKSYRLPTPPQMRNSGNYLISLGQLCRFLALEAERLGANIFPEFAVTKILYQGDEVIGVATGDKGLDALGQPTERYQPGMHCYAKQVIFAEGCRGSLTQQLFHRFELRKNCSPQTYGIGFKELWEIPPELHTLGKVAHTIGWPLDNRTYGGSFLYHFEKNILSIGFVVGLDYQDAYLSPYEAFQQFKSHPSIRPLLENSKRIAYGARTLSEGGLQSLPKLTFKGGLIVGDAAGFLNVPKIKGIHTAMKSGMVAAESIVPLLDEQKPPECVAYSQNIRASWVWKELFQARNIRPAMSWGLWPGLAYAAIDTYVFRGHAPWTFRNHADHSQLKKAKQSKKIGYPKPDSIVAFDLMSSVFLTHAVHEENQPCHLKIIDPKVPIAVNLKEYAGPEQRYCPAGVYEFIGEADAAYLQINAANCIHCKACDIKDPTQNIVWTPPEGGCGPQYQEM